MDNSLRITDEKLAEQKQLTRSALNWFDSKVAPAIRDARRRYEMKLADEAERTARKLSKLPSTKSVAAVDRFVERLAIEMFQDPDSMSFTARAASDPKKDEWARWLTQDFIYRSKHTFDFFTWHLASSTAGGVDGLEAGLVRWCKESYKEELPPEYHALNPDGSTTPIQEETYNQISALYPEAVKVVNQEREVVVTDTWVIDQLEPGKDIIWDPKIPYLDINLGTFCTIFLDRTVDDIEAISKARLINPITREEIESYQKNTTDSFTISNSSENIKENFIDVDLQKKNRVKLWMFFEKINYRWYVSFSLDGTKRLNDEPKLVNDLFFGGRQVNRLPAVVGTTKLHLWKQIGRSIPMTIAPIEDEWTDHRNNVNDYTKQLLTGRWWKSEDSDVDVDQLINQPVVLGKLNEDFGQMPVNPGLLDVLRNVDTINNDMREITPSTIAGSARGVVPKGTNTTLGGQQLGKMESDEKQSVHILTRNKTFLEKILWLIAQNTMAFETDEVILRIAGQKAGIQVPEQVLPNGQRILDLSVLDFNVDIQINAGLGSAPRYQQADTLQQLAEWHKVHNVPFDYVAASRKLKALAGFGPDEFVPPKPPPPPPPPAEFKLTTTVPFELLSPQAKAFIEMKLLSGATDVDAKVKGESPALNLARQNGGGMVMPDRTKEIVDGTGPEAVMMSQGGQHVPE